MTRQQYAAQRLDPRWQRKRLEIMQRDGFKCQHCTSADKTLNVHHYYYIHGRPCWEYPDFALITLCEDCHKTEQAASKEGLGELEQLVANILTGFRDLISADFFAGLISDWKLGACDDAYVIDRLREIIDANRKEPVVV